MKKMGMSTPDRVGPANLSDQNSIQAWPLMGRLVGLADWAAAQLAVSLFFLLLLLRLFLFLFSI
jgi:hypothetical protein